MHSQKYFLDATFSNLQEAHCKMNERESVKQYSSRACMLLLLLLFSCFSFILMLGLKKDFFYEALRHLDAKFILTPCAFLHHAFTKNSFINMSVKKIFFMNDSKAFLYEYSASTTIILNN